MTTLELRYRRLLRAYPAGHRNTYEEEMIGVLMADAEPGRRFPGPADALDLLRAGLTARLGQALHTQRRTGWRDAAAVAGLLTALALAGVASTRLSGGLRVFLSGEDAMGAHGVDGLLLLDPAARALVWIAVTVAALIGLRRTVVGLAAVGVLVEAGTLAWWWDLAPWQAVRLAWAPATALLTLAAFALAVRARPIRSLAEPRIRRRAAVLTGTLLAVPLVFSWSWDFSGLPLAADLTPGVLAGRLLVLVATPVVVFAAGLAVLRAGERFAARGRGQVRAHE